MGIYLSLIITDKEDEKSFLKSNQVEERMRLKLDQDYDFFNLFQEVTMVRIWPVAYARRFPKHTRLVIFEDEGPTLVNQDGMGNPLSYFLAGDFKGKKLPKNASPINRAAIAYLRELPKDFPVVLYWY